MQYGRRRRGDSVEIHSFPTRAVPGLNSTAVFFVGRPASNIGRAHSGGAWLRDLPGSDESR